MTTSHPLRMRIQTNGTSALVAFWSSARLVVAASLLIVCFGTALADGVEPARVLIINSFGRENSPYEVFASLFRSELAQRVSTPVAFYETSLDGARFEPARDAGPFVRFLQDRFQGRPPDLVVPIGPLAARFYAQYRAQLFPDVPMMLAASEERVTAGVTLGPRDASMPLRLNIPRLIENILQALPATSTVAIIIGDSPIERFWVGAARSALKPLEARVSFMYLNSLSLEDIEQRVATLPPHSAILFCQMYVDGAGVSREHDRTLARVRAAANAPVYGLYASQLGAGIVGGPLMSEKEAAIRAAGIARVVLGGDVQAQRVSEPLELGAPVYDWRELQRWGIPESRLPQGSTILYRQPSLWDQYKLAVAAAVGILVVQSLLLAGLLIQRARRRRAEREAQLLSGRILTAHEDERRRLARELHDDVTPRLARLAVDAARAQGGGPAAADAANGLSMHDELVRLSEDVHAFSYRLHPTVLDDLGLIDALHAECDRAARGQEIPIGLHAEGIPEQLPRDVAVCLFRIAQEALRNIARHAKARAVNVTLARKDGGLQLAIVDDGVGFDAARPRDGHGLGHASMRERVRQVDGALRIHSTPGAGTTVLAWVPLPRGTS